MGAKEHLKNIVNWLNENYNQNSDNYSIFYGAKPEVVRYDEHTAISLWACGAIVCIESIIYFIEEDDGYWYLSKNEEYRDCGCQNCFSIGWAESFCDAMKMLVDYTKKNGKPIYYSGTNTICHYTL